MESTSPQNHDTRKPALFAGTPISLWSEVKINSQWSAIVKPLIDHTLLSYFYSITVDWEPWDPPCFHFGMLIISVVFLNLIIA